MIICENCQNLTGGNCYFHRELIVCGVIKFKKRQIIKTKKFSDIIKLEKELIKNKKGR